MNGLENGPYAKKEGYGEFGKRLKDERIRMGYKISEFADAVGVNQTAISGYENRGCMPKFDIVIAMARVLDCSLDWLAGIE
jgi:transcriptional regulator with XRE-family HTH domain